METLPKSQLGLFRCFFGIHIGQFSLPIGLDPLTTEREKFPISSVPFLVTGWCCIVKFGHNYFNYKNETGSGFFIIAGTQRMQMTKKLRTTMVSPFLMLMKSLRVTVFHFSSHLWFHLLLFYAFYGLGSWYLQHENDLRLVTMTIKYVSVCLYILYILVEVFWTVFRNDRLCSSHQKQKTFWNCFLFKLSSHMKYGAD